MRIDRLTMEGLCTCGGTLEVEAQPEPKLPMLVEVVVKKCNRVCGRKVIIHIQEIMPLPDKT